MAIAEFKLDLFSALQELDFNYKIFVLEGIVEELRKIIVEQRGKYKRAATLALAIISAKEIAKLPSKGDVDDALVEYSKKGYLILTQDQGLKRRLQKPYLTIRQLKKIIVVA